MATLHVRNFPDALYARLRANAESNGRSIGAEAIFHLQSALIASMTAGYPRARRRQRHGRATRPFEHFSPRARQVVVDAQTEARELGHGAIGTEHLLLGLLREPPTPAGVLLAEAGLDHAAARRSIEEVVGKGGAPPSATLPFTPDAKKAMELALRASLEANDPAIWPYHLLLGIARESDGLGARLLAEHSLDAEAVRFRNLARVTNVLVETEERFRVIELTGDPGEWESQLNELAGLGYRLEQIVDKRAIFSSPDDSAVDRGP